MHDLLVGVAQRLPLPAADPLPAFADDVARTMDRHPGLGMLVYPELHLVGVESLPPASRGSALAASAQRLDSPFIASLGRIAATHRIWLCPGSIVETDESGLLHNTQLLFSPDGWLRAGYRKMFPWRPYEEFTPGTRFVVQDLDGAGTVGLSNCYDVWFPEHSRQLAWLGAEVIVNVAQSCARDRVQELVLARAHAIMNQCMFISANCAAPFGRGRSIIVDAEGEILAEAGPEEMTLVASMASGRILETRAYGTAGLNRPWEQFRPDDAQIRLPMYEGVIAPSRWSPR